MISSLGHGPATPPHLMLPPLIPAWDPGEHRNMREMYANSKHFLQTRAFGEPPIICGHRWSFTLTGSQVMFPVEIGLKFKVSIRDG